MGWTYIGAHCMQSRLKASATCMKESLFFPYYGHTYIEQWEEGPLVAVNTEHTKDSPVFSGR